MEIQDFRIQVEKWPRNRRGRLMLSNVKKEQIENAFRTSGLSVTEFSAAAGLKLATVVKILKGSKNVSLKVKRKKSHLFRSVTVTPSQEEISWSVCGPHGLNVKCKNLAQLAQLWRALC